MELKWGHFCVDAQPNGWSVMLFNVLSGFGADSGQPLALPDMPIVLAVRVHAPPGTASVDHLIHATLHDAAGQAITATQTVPLNFIALPAPYPLLGLASVPLNNWTPLPSVGRYAVQLAVDDFPVGKVPVVIYPRQGKIPSTLLPGGPETQLDWAHHLVEYRTDPRMAGMMSLGGVFELLPPTHPRNGHNLKGEMLLLQIQAALSIRTNRTLRADLLNRNDEEARDAKGRLLSPPFVRPITLRRLNPSWDFLVSTATVRFENDLWLSPGDYRFRFQIDGQPFGRPLDLSVVSAP